jgi:hypothetical protein
MLFERNAKYIKIQNKCLYHLYRQNALFYNKTYRHDITVILLKVALNTITLTLFRAKKNSVVNTI